MKRIFGSETSTCNVSVVCRKQQWQHFFRRQGCYNNMMVILFSLVSNMEQTANTAVNITTYRKWCSLCWPQKRLCPGHSVFPQTFIIVDILARHCRKSTGVNNYMTNEHRWASSSQSTGSLWLTGTLNGTNFFHLCFSCYYKSKRLQCKRSVPSTLFRHSQSPALRDLVDDAGDIN